VGEGCGEAVVDGGSVAVVGTDPVAIGRRTEPSVADPEVADPSFASLR
jgi:hypothetical protein